MLTQKTLKFIISLKTRSRTSLDDNLRFIICIHTYIHTTLFVLAGYKKKAAYADVDLLKTYLKYLQHLIGLILQITLKYL